jgi:hypothetical protein
MEKQHYATLGTLSLDSKDWVIRPCTALGRVCYSTLYSYRGVNGSLFTLLMKSKVKNINFA